MLIATQMEWRIFKLYMDSIDGHISLDNGSTSLKNLRSSWEAFKADSQKIIDMADSDSNEVIAYTYSSLSEWHEKIAKVVDSIVTINDDETERLSTLQHDAYLGGIFKCFC